MSYCWERKVMTRTHAPAITVSLGPDTPKPDYRFVIEDEVDESTGETSVHLRKEPL